jgi:hypothetical protein
MGLPMCATMCARRMRQNTRGTRPARSPTVLSLERLRDDLRAAGGRWTVGRTSMTALSPDQRRARLGYEPSPDEPSLQRREAAARLARAHRETESPAHGACDLRALRGTDFVPPVRDTRTCACTGAMHAVIATTLRIDRDDPRLDVAELTVDQAARGHARLVEPFALAVRGATAVVRVRAWRELHTLAAMKAWLATRGPLLSVYAVHEDFYAYAGGVYHHVSGELEGGHCAAVIGFDDGGAYWIAQNTWGTAWGERGCFRIAFGERGIDASMWGVELQ